MIKGTVVQWEACDTTWYGRVKFVHKEWAYVCTIGSADPKAFIEREHVQCFRIDELKVKQ